MESTQNIYTSFNKDEGVKCGICRKNVQTQQKTECEFIMMNIYKNSEIMNILEIYVSCVYYDICINN